MQLSSFVSCCLQSACNTVNFTMHVVPTQAPSYTNVFADALIAEAERDSRIVGIHAAMGGGTGLNRFDARCVDLRFKERVEAYQLFPVLVGSSCHAQHCATYHVCPKKYLVQT